MTRVATAPLPTDGQPSADLDHLASPSPARPVDPWPTWRLYAFRFAVAVSIIAGARMLQLFSSYLMTAAAAMVDPIFGAIGQFESQAVMRTGAWVIDTALGRELAPWQQMVTRNNPTAASGTICYAIGALIIASAITLLWSALDRKRRSYTTLFAVHRVYVRYLVAMVIMIYAMVKVIPTQFGVLTPGAAIRPYGDFSRFDVLWNFMAASTGYTVFTGLLELSGAVLLMFRRTTALGALIVFAALVNVFALDIAYNIRGAVIIALLLLALSTMIIAPYLAGLFAIFVRGRTAELPSEPATFLRASRYAPPLTVAFIGVLLLARVSEGIELRRSYTSTHTFSGLFDVLDLSNPQDATASSSVATTWSRVASDDRYGGGTVVAVQAADGKVRRYRANANPETRTWTLEQFAGGGAIATLRYEVQTDDSITLTGDIEAKPATLRLVPVDRAKLPVLLRDR